MSKEVQEKIDLLNKTKQEVVNIHNQICRVTPVDADSTEVMTAAARIVLAERKLGLINQELTLLEAQLHINNKSGEKSKKVVKKTTKKKVAKKTKKR